MRKRIAVAVAIASICLLVFAPTGFYFAVKHQREFLIARAERVLGRKITFDRIDPTFWPLGARLANFTMADDPAYFTGAFLHAKEIRVQLRVLPLFIGQFRIASIAIESPVITVVRDSSGRHNFGYPARVKKSPRESADKKIPRETQIGFLAFASSLAISDGTLSYRDLAGGELTITRIGLRISDFEPDQPFEMELAAAVNAAKPNLEIKSRIGPVAGNRDFGDIPLAGEINATDLDLGKVNKALPHWRKSLPRALRFDGVYTIKELKFKGPLNNLSLKGAITGTDASVRFE